MATIIGTYPNTYDINGKYVILIDDNKVVNRDYQEKQTGFIGVGNGRIAAICDSIEEIDMYIEENNLSLYDSLSI